MKTRGFTLIEILIVMVIISIVGAVAILSISQNENAKLDTLSKEISNAISLAETQAMLQPAILGFANSDNAYQFYQYQEPQKENQNPWRPLHDAPFGKRPIQTGIQVTLKVQNKVISPAENLDNATPVLIISTNGDATPFVILIGKRGSKPRYRITGDENGGVTREKIS